jgi:glycosyltransferase involved in cell wall biosynthesis
MPEDSSKRETGLRLCVLSTLKVRFHDANVVLTRKFIDGMTEYARLWPGPVDVLAEPGDGLSHNLDHVDLPLDQLPFGVKSVRFADPRAMGAAMEASAAVLASLDNRQMHVAAICAQNRIPCVFVSEYSLKTRRQMVYAQTRNPLLRLRRSIWQGRLERKLRLAVASASGIQCNGTPTYEAYRDLNPKPLLFFDTRVCQSMLVTPETLEARTATLAQGAPLRLAFSGRLTAIKGADHLPVVAAELRRRGIAFTMDLFGGGDQENQLRRMIENQGLSRQVRLRGVVDFATELMPEMARNIDLFVCCHRQGDPSCTYLETMSCGTPIVGYDNEAFRGIVTRSAVGWISPMDDPAALAQTIANLDADRPSLAHAAVAARKFAAGHVFEEIMAARIEHIKMCATAFGSRQ